MYRIGVDIGGTKIAVGVFDAEKQLIASEKYYIAEAGDLPSFIKNSVERLCGGRGISLKDRGRRGQKNYKSAEYQSAFGKFCAGSRVAVGLSRQIGAGFEGGGLGRIRRGLRTGKVFRGLRYSRHGNRNGNCFKRKGL